VIEVPPVVGPEFGEVELTVGAAGGAPPPPLLDFGRMVLSFFKSPGAVLTYVCADRTIWSSERPSSLT
jgi:hypothetical protein